MKSAGKDQQTPGLRAMSRKSESELINRIKNSGIAKLRHHPAPVSPR